jgi:hypothetical protein
MRLTDTEIKAIEDSAKVFFSPGAWFDYLVRD